VKSFFFEGGVVVSNKASPISSIKIFYGLNIRTYGTSFCCVEGGGSLLSNVVSVLRDVDALLLRGKAVTS
jgi:hypothetical protein